MKLSKNVNCATRFQLRSTPEPCKNAYSRPTHSDLNSHGVRACMRACLCACVHACVFVCVLACSGACVHACVGGRGGGGVEGCMAVHYCC